ncbi:methyltransferase [Sedimentitalea todarodis]|uniref:Methyltransferase n=1 Tax=Sedimentitalea todarodis TaxID=1631240 RepID=A0ABU3VKF7_9RHOB|nr:methyltransferase [Sedimentitalea todarodis]MDU9006663.1 methyltransferase [Sedimentitalea todarodis]
MLAAGDQTSRVQLSPSVWFARLVARPGFQKWASRLPIGRAVSERDGAEIFDILQGFVKSQVLLALVEMDILQRLLDQPASAEQLSLSSGVPHDRMEGLLKAGVAMRLLKSRRDGRYILARRGAAILGVPGLPQMISHNRAFYADMGDPVSLLRGVSETHLARFWPYVLGKSDEIPHDVAERYSSLMAESQSLVAQDTLRMVNFGGINTLLDIGGGSGAFLKAVLRKYPKMNAMLFDLPEVIPAARANFGQSGLESRVSLRPGSFREQPLPDGADAISLIRVLYDHDDKTVSDLLSKAFAALPVGGRLIVSEPMSGGSRPEPAGDIYFSFYTMAMGTGRVRSARQIADMCEAAGFADIKLPRAPRPYVSSAVTCSKAP